MPTQITLTQYTTVSPPYKTIRQDKNKYKGGGLVQDGGVEGRALIFSCKNTENKTIY